MSPRFPAMQIIPLGAQPQHALRLAALHLAEWGHLYTGWNEATVLAEFAVQHSDGRLPTTLIAVEHAALIGSVSLILDDLPGCEHLNPWLASFYVLPEYRRCGRGDLLLRAAEETLLARGITTVYLFTQTRAPYFAARGWLTCAETQMAGFAATVMQRILPLSR